jgi:hypothetical protein
MRHEVVNSQSKNKTGVWRKNFFDRLKTKVRR